MSSNIIQYKNKYNKYSIYLLNLSAAIMPISDPLCNIISERNYNYKKSMSIKINKPKLILKDRFKCKCKINRNNKINNKKCKRRNWERKYKVMDFCSICQRMYGNMIKIVSKLWGISVLLSKGSHKLSEIYEHYNFWDFREYRNILLRLF